MKQYKYFILFVFISSFTNQGLASQKNDTLTISAANLRYDNIKYGRASYIVFNKKTKESPAQGIYLVHINVTPVKYKQEPVIEIAQQWDGKDTIIHRANTYLNAMDYSTRFHQTWWKGLTYTSTFDFDTHNILIEGNIADSTKQKIDSAFDESFNSYNLNWHSDLFIFTRLPYKSNRYFRIRLFDPGFGRPSDEIYFVSGSESLMNTSGKKISCWVMERKGKVADSYQKFWVDKKSKLVLKEEDLFNNRYRFKIKLEIADPV